MHTQNACIANHSARTKHTNFHKLCNKINFTQQNNPFLTYNCILPATPRAATHIQPKKQSFRIVSCAAYYRMCVALLSLLNAKTIQSLPIHIYTDMQYMIICYVDVRAFWTACCKYLPFSISSNFILNGLLSQTQCKHGTIIVTTMQPSQYEVVQFFFNFLFNAKEATTNALHRRYGKDLSQMTGRYQLAFLWKGHFCLVTKNILNRTGYMCAILFFSC